MVARMARAARFVALVPYAVRDTSQLGEGTARRVAGGGFVVMGCTQRDGRREGLVVSTPDALFEVLHDFSFFIARHEEEYAVIILNRKK